MVSGKKLFAIVVLLFESRVRVRWLVVVHFESVVSKFGDSKPSNMYASSSVCTT